MGSTAKQRRRWHLMLKAQWQGKEITTCEVKFDGCVGSFGLAPAHSKDRRDIHTKEDFFQVVAGCSECHWKLDREMPKDERLRIVQEVIANRA